VYRTDKYQKLKVEIERQTKKLEKKKEAHGEATLDRTQKRKMDREEERLKSTNRDLVRGYKYPGVPISVPLPLPRTPSVLTRLSV
jgi:hypothetical protein